MDLYVTLCFLLFGTFLFSLPLLHECKEPKSCTFQVNKTKSCPSNQTEWNKRSKDMNCSKTNGYMCIPNESFTELLEFCYDHPRILILEGTCLYFSRQCSDVEVYNCRNFEYGCPSTHYPSSKIYEYPSCIHVERGCFVAEPFCKSQPPQKENEFNVATLSISLGVSILAFFLCVLLFYFIKKRRRVRRGNDMEKDRIMIESIPFLEYEHREALENYEESRLEKAMFDQWKQDDRCFVSTKACKEVEKMIESRNLVIVAGHSGSGKSAIIQHIALKYRKQGWTVRRVKKVEDILDEYSSSRFQKNKTLFVFNDPLGKESFDELLNNSWQAYGKKLHLYLKTAKLVMSCRMHIIYDARVTRYLVNQSRIVDIDDNQYKLSVEEKQQILTTYTSKMNLSDKDCSKIVEVETYFPLLCKLYSSRKEFNFTDTHFFTEPVTVLRNEIQWFRSKDQGKYCALALLVFFNDDLCVSDLLKNKDTEKKFEHTLKLCGLPNRTSLSEIRDNLNSLENCFVKKVGNSYHFSHDFVMEVTTHVFGTYYANEIIKYADIGFLRKRVKLGYCEKYDDTYTIFLSDKYAEELGERLFTELFGEHLLDVVLNPCLRNENVIAFLMRKLEYCPHSLYMLLKTKKLSVNQQELEMTSKSLLMSKLEFLELSNELSPLVAMVVFCHTQLSIYCLNTLRQKQIHLNRWFLIPQMCCNGSIELFNYVCKHHAEEYFKKTWNGLCPIHVVSVFHNYALLYKFIKIGVNVNQKTVDYGGWTPLMLAAGNDTQEYGHDNHNEFGATRRDKTVLLLLSNGADPNLCKMDGASPLYVACQSGHDSTVQLLLSCGADTNLCKMDGASPLHVACQNGHESTVKLLLMNEAKINLRMEDGASPLYIACENGHDSTVQLLLRKGADINICKKDGASPLYVACQNGHESTVQLLLSNGADINLRMEDGSSPLYIACENGQVSTTELLLRKGADINICMKDGASPLYVACQNGHESTVQLLLSRGADINIFMKDGASPLYIACKSGHESIVQLLLSYGAKIDLCKKDGASPLYVACQSGHDSTVHLLLSNNANIDLCKKDGASPLYIACQNGYDSIVQLLLSNEANINLCMKNGASPLYIACRNGHDGTVQLLLRKGADINICMKDGASPLFVACQNKQFTIVLNLLLNGADINLCMENGASPLHVACLNGHESVVQLLLRYSANIDMCKKDGASPLYVACQSGHDSSVQHLLRYGADINLGLEHGVSPLYVAFERRCCETVNILIKNGADTSLLCGWKVNPALVVCFDEHDSVVKYLMQKDNIQNNLYDPGSYFSLFVSCQLERVARMIFYK